MRVFLDGLELALKPSCVRVVIENIGYDDTHVTITEKDVTVGQIDEDGDMVEEKTLEFDAILYPERPEEFNEEAS